MNACDAMAERTRSVSPHLASLTVHQRTKAQLTRWISARKCMRNGNAEKHHAAGKGMKKRTLMLDASRRQKDMDYDSVVQVVRIDGVVCKKRLAKAKCLSTDGVSENLLPEYTS